MQLRDYEDNKYEKRVPEKESFSRLSTKEKIGVYWELYKGWTIFIVIALLAVIYSMYWYQNNKDNSSLYIALTNSNTNLDSSFLTTGYKTKDAQGNDFIIDINDGIILPRSNEEGIDQYSAANVQKYDALLTDGTIDISVTNETSLKNYSDSTVYADLRDVLSSDILENSAVELYYRTDSDGQSVPIGIYVDVDSQLASLYDGDIDRYVITISAMSGNSSEAAEYVEFLISPYLS